MTEHAGNVPAPGGSSPAVTGDRHAWRDAADEWRTNWRVGAAAFIATGLSFVAYQSVSSLFVLPLQQEFGWSRAEVAYAHNASIAIAVAAPFVGRVTDRFGARRVMLAGMALLSLAYCGFAAMNGALPIFYALSAFAGVAGLSTSGLTCARVISQAFVRSRGLSRCPFPPEQPARAHPGWRRGRPGWQSRGGGRRGARGGDWRRWRR